MKAMACDSKKENIERKTNLIHFGCYFYADIV